MPLVEPAKIAEWQSAQKAKLKPLEDQLAAMTNAADKKKLSKQIQDVKGEKPPFDWALRTEATRAAAWGW